MANSFVIQCIHMNRAISFESKLVLILLCMFSIFLSTFRVLATDSYRYLFLNWNLFLAILPWLTIQWLKHRNPKPLIMIGLIAFWLLFFPNSPYILTDLFHLQKSFGMPIWYDLIMILSFAWTGLLFGFLSLMDLEEIVLRRYPRVPFRLVIIVLFFITSFGVYLGRFLRWNSWDIIANPLHLFSDIFYRFADPSAHLRTWGVTLLMGSMLCLMYFSLKMFRNRTV